MSNIKLDKNTLSDLKEKGVGKIKLYFYDAGCSGTKVDIEENPDINGLELVSNIDGIDIYCEEGEKYKFESCSITRTVTADHTGKENVRYIYSSEEVKDRCGCGSSFSFDNKEVKIDFEKLREMKKNFGK